jgi:LysM repeat protein
MIRTVIKVLWIIWVTLICMDHCMITSRPTAYGSDWSLDETLGVPPPKHHPTSAVIPTSEYIVVAGDTLGDIAARHRTTWERLWELNKDRIPDPNLILVGQRIRINGKAVTEIVKVLSREEKIDKLGKFMFKTSHLDYRPRVQLEEMILQQKRGFIGMGLDFLFAQRKSMDVIYVWTRELEIWYLAEAIVDTTTNDDDFYKLVSLAWQESHFVNRLGKAGEVGFFQFLPSTVKERFQLDEIGLTAKLFELSNNPKMSTELALEMMKEYKWQWKYWNHGEDFQFNLNNKIYWFMSEWRKK